MRITDSDRKQLSESKPEAQLELSARSFANLDEAQPGLVERTAIILGGKSRGWKRISIRENQEYWYYGSY